MQSTDDAKKPQCGTGSRADFNAIIGMPALGLANVGKTPSAKCSCDMQSIALETQSIGKDAGGDPFNGNSALLFSYAQELAGRMAPGVNLSDIGKAIYLTPPFQPGIVILEPDPEPFMNYQVWQVSDGMPTTASPIWDTDGGSYFDYYSEYVALATLCA
ncbi:hypothetical protein ABW19_dt0200152 [Dactylella cylindrospora]|nr:hypothetical protein ABW19_dt0200152 [Dactylella cylindrospora]